MGTTFGLHHLLLREQQFFVEKSQIFLVTRVKRGGESFLKEFLKDFFWIFLGNERNNGTE
jgi:hypothetical protein